MGSYEILMKLSLAAMVCRCNTTAQLHCKSAAACLPLRGMCATRSGLLHLLHKHGEMARATIRPRRESVRPHAARKLPAMQADCCLALEALGGCTSCTSVSLGFRHSHRLLLRCSCSMRRAPMRLEIGILSQVRATVLCTCTYMYLCTPLTVQAILC